MTVQNQSYGGVLKNKLNLGQNTKRLFQVFAKLPLTTTETELGYCHHSECPSCPTSCLKILGNYDISWKSRKCLELKESAQLATRNEGLTNSLNIVKNYL